MTSHPSGITSKPSFHDLDIPLPELIALDIDDTLVPHMGSISQRVIEAVAGVRERGVAVALATGRSLSTTAPIGRAAGIDGWVVCSNGAILATIEPEGVVEATSFDPRPILERLQPQLPGARFAVEDIHGTFHTMSADDFDAGALGLQIREVPFEHLLDEPAVRLVVHSNETEHMNGGFGDVAKTLGLHTVIFGVGDKAWMDVGPQGVNKATGLTRLCALLDINPAKTLTMGDSYNDVEMLEWAGTGIAMATAPASVMAAADAVTSGEPGVGVAEVLEFLAG